MNYPNYPNYPPEVHIDILAHRHKAFINLLQILYDSVNVVALSYPVVTDVADAVLEPTHRAHSSVFDPLCAYFRSYF